jgi:flagellar protein FlgJ
MTPSAFVKKYWQDALRSQLATGISAKATLAQAALESAWGAAAPGNMFFGIKDTDGVNGNEQLLTTTEYHTSMNVKYPVVISVDPVVRNGKKMFKYKVKDYFRKYATPADSFIDHGRFFQRNPRYAAAMAAKADPNKFADKIAAAGYASDPNYAASLKRIIAMIEKHIPKS